MKYLTRMAGIATLALTTGCASQKAVNTPTYASGPTHECFSVMVETVEKAYSSDGNMITETKIVKGLRPEGEYILEHELDNNGDGIPDSTIIVDFACDYDFGNLTHGMLEVDGKLESIWNPKKSKWEAPKE